MSEVENRVLDTDKPVAKRKKRPPPVLVAEREEREGYSFEAGICDDGKLHMHVDEDDRLPHMEFVHEPLKGVSTLSLNTDVGEIVLYLRPSEVVDLFRALEEKLRGY